MVLMGVVHQGGPPSLAEVALHLGVQIEDIDANYGVLLLDPEQGVYTVRVREDRIRPTSSEPYRGPFSDPDIAPLDD
jgi:hypothetical protein